MIPRYPPLSRVGAWLTTHEFLRDMVKRGHRVVVTAYDGGARFAPPLEHEGVLVERHFRTIGQPDVVVGHAGDDGSALAIAHRFDAPLVLMVHGGVPAQVRLRLEGAALAVFNSHSFAREVGWDGPSLVAHPPIEPAEYRTTPGDRVTLVNLSAAKGGALFWQIAAAMPDVEFLAVRGGYAEQIMFGGYPNVLLHRLTNEMAVDVYSRTRLLLMPTYAETWGRVGLEAGVSGIPTVARRLPGILEALGDAALYVEDDDLEAWVAAIGAALEPAAWPQLSRRARRRAARFQPGSALKAFARAVEGLSDARCPIGA